MKGMKRKYMALSNTDSYQEVSIDAANSNIRYDDNHGGRQAMLLAGSWTKVRDRHCCYVGISSNNKTR